MIKIVAKCIAKESKLEEFIKLAKELVIESRKEAGNLTYHFYQSRDKKNILTFIEEWKDKEATEIHAASEHFTRIFTQLGELSKEPSIIDFYDELI